MSDASALRAIQDRLEIEDLLHRYAEMVDRREWQKMDSVFALEATIDYTSAGGQKGPFRETLAWLDVARAGRAARIGRLGSSRVRGRDRHFGRVVVADRDRGAIRGPNPDVRIARTDAVQRDGHRLVVGLGVEADPRVSLRGRHGPGALEEGAASSEEGRGDGEAVPAHRRQTQGNDAQDPGAVVQ